jgi:hypothetical protein
MKVVMRSRLRKNGTFLTLRLAELEYGIPYMQLREWVLAGKLSRLDPDVVGRTYMIKRADLDAFISKNMTAVR